MPPSDAEPVAFPIPGSDGVMLNALAWSQVGRPLLLLHGFGHSARVWDEVAPALTDRHRVVALDQRGHGDSGRDPEGRYNHPEFARDLDPVTASLGGPAAVLVGHSMGAYASLHFADAHPDRVAALVLVDASADLDHPGVKKFRPDRVARDPSFDSLDAYAASLERALPRATPEQRERLATHWAVRRDDGRFTPKLDPASLMPRGNFDPKGDRSEWAREETARLWAILGRLRVPVLVVRGAESPMLRVEVARRMVDDAIADAEFAEVERAGHPVMIDNPEGLVDVLRAFLSKLPD